MYELKKMSKSCGIIDFKSSYTSDDSKILKHCCERGGLLLVEGLCFGSHVAIDANGDKFALVIRRKNFSTWIEFSKLRKNQKLDFGEG